jgi:hypothetical protein
METNSIDGAGMSDIFNEVDEELRRERLKTAWSRSAPWGIAAAVLAIAGAIGWSLYQWNENSRDANSSVRYEQALDLAQNGNYQEADAIFMNLADGKSAGYATLSKFRHAAIEVSVEPTKAVERFDQLATDSELPTVLQDLARIRAGQVLLDRGSYDDVIKRLASLAETRNNVWRHSAREMLALSAWKIGNEDDVRKWGEMLVSDMGAPRGSRGRVQLVLDLVGDPKPQPAGANTTTPAP